MANSFDELRALQLRFQAYLEGDSEDFEQDVISTDDARAEHRLAAYYNAYRIRLIDCLATDFPVLQKTIGEEDFEYLVLDYLKQHPSDHPSVRWVGRHMPEFVASSNLDKREFLSELAAFEWTQGLCFDAAESDVLFRLEDMSQIAPELWPQITLQFHPSLRWLDLQWNAPPYWAAIDKGDNKDDIPQPQREEYPTRWLMWRKQLKPSWRSLDAAEAWAIEAALNGADFASLCEGLLEWIGEDAVAMSAAGYLKQWISDDMVCAVETH